MENSKSLNCASCGAGLPKPTFSVSRCDYCGNHNKILSDGNTLIYSIDNQGREAPPKSDFVSLKKMEKVAVILAMTVVPLVVMRWYNRR